MLTSCLHLVCAPPPPVTDRALSRRRNAAVWWRLLFGRLYPRALSRSVSVWLCENWDLYGRVCVIAQVALRCCGIRYLLRWCRNAIGKDVREQQGACLDSSSKNWPAAVFLCAFLCLVSLTWTWGVPGFGDCVFFFFQSGFEGPHQAVLPRRHSCISITAAVLKPCDSAFSFLLRLFIFYVECGLFCGVGFSKLRAVKTR